MADDRRVVESEGRREVEERIAQLEERLGLREREVAGELGDVDQHPADQATELYDREQDIQRLETLREQLRALDDAARRPDAPPVPAGERTQPDPGDDDSTPLDEPATPPQDLAAIPMGREQTVDKDAQDLDAPGMVYREGADEPAVGEPDPAQEGIERSYRPER